MMRKIDTKLFLLCVFLVFTILSFSPDAYSDCTITLVNIDDTGEGLNDETLRGPEGGNEGVTVGELRQNAFAFAADKWATILDSCVDIIVNASFSSTLFCQRFSGVLGSAGPIWVVRGFSGEIFSGTWYHIALANALAGIDLITSGSNPHDINATFQADLGEPNCLFSLDWYYGFDGNPGTNQLDFVSLLLHELAHGLGFSDLESSSGALLGEFPSVYLRFLSQKIDTTTLNELPIDDTASSDTTRSNAFVDDQNLLWDGQCVTDRIPFLSYTGGVDTDFDSPLSPLTLARMYAPNPYEGGSSVSHYDVTFTPNELMEPSINDNIQDMELTTSLLTDIGWSATNISNSIVTFVPDELTFASTTDISGCTGYEGRFSFSATLKYLSSYTLSNIWLEVSTLTNDNLLANADGGAGGEGATLTVPEVDNYSDGTLLPSSSEFVDVDFDICLTDFSTFDFFVNVYASESCTLVP